MTATKGSFAKRSWDLAFQIQRCSSLRPTSHPQYRPQSRPYSSAPSAADSNPKPSHPPTYYTLFPQTCPLGPPPTGPFQIDTRALRREFLKLQQKYHPDLQRDSGKSKGEAERASAYVNAAYGALSDTLGRAEYLLGLRGMDPSSDEGGKLGGDGEGAEVLGVVMEAQERVEELDEGGERGKEERVGVVLGVLRENAERVVQAHRGLQKAFESGDWEEARREAVRLRYWRNVNLTAWEWDERVGGGEVRRSVEEIRSREKKERERQGSGSGEAGAGGATLGIMDYLWPL